MTVCETCGVEGYTQLLFYCLKCQIVAVHRYCMDGLSTIEDEEISWYCEECVPRVPEPPEPSRKCERVAKTIDREELRRKSRKKWKNSLSLLESNKPDIVKDCDDVKVTNDTSDFNLPSSKDGVPGDRQENYDEKITQHKQVIDYLKINDPKCLNSLDDIDNIRPIVLALKNPEPCNETTDSGKGSCKRTPVIRKKKDLLARKIVRRMRTKRGVVTRVKEGDQSSHGDVEDERVKVEDNVVLPVVDSIIPKDGKHEKYPNEVDSKLTREVNDTSNSRATKDSDFADQEPEIVEEAIVSVHDHKGEDVQSSCSSRKRRSLIIEMEYSDDDDDANNAMTVLSPLKSSNDGELFCTSSSKPPVELGSDYHAPPMKAADHNLTPAAPLNLGACVPYPPCPSQLVDHVPSQPVIDVIWRGGCVISNNIDPTSFELEAHVSNKASPVVYGAAIALPKIIDFEIISKRHAWPKSFKKSPPTGEIIGLYFFPVGERDEIFYRNLLAKMVDRQLMLMSQINNLELLVFCSHELPEEEWRFQRKYYLWGVFRLKQQTTLPMTPSATQVSNSYLSSPPDMSRDDVYQNPRNSNHRFAESANPDNLNHPTRASGSQTSDRDQPYGSHKRSYHHERPPPKFRNHRPETDGYEYDDGKTSYQSEVQRHNYRIKRQDSYRSRGNYRRHRGHERYD